MMQLLFRFLRLLGVAALLCAWGQGAMADVALRSIHSETRGWLGRTTTVTIDLDDRVPFSISTPEDGQIAIALTGVDGSIRPSFQAGTVISRFELTDTVEGGTLTLRGLRELELQSAAITQLPNGAAQLVLSLAAGARVSQPALNVVEEGHLALPLVVLDPGHGGIDPGAVREDISEKDIALAFGLELRDALIGSGRYDVQMTRSTDEFITLRDRVRFARDADAAVFVSLHANTVTRGNASGTAIYTLSDGASSAEAAALAELENRADTLGGVDLGVEDDDLALLLTDMAQRETNARSTMLARATVEAMRHAVGVIRTNPHRSAGFRVLKAPDIPSMLIELGFLSDATDRINMMSPRWRAHAAQGILAALDDWVERDRVLSARSPVVAGPTAIAAGE
ncbi:N-acetylmuramoyl-L-alanine amidase [Monaibacterium marinum]|uniref:N-acetylmuramoyl-L-alanine amidase n=2 Tax=Pontivivens marinum TaxID=1690039 RepID=A0A2C9CW53_9RHOB|nr:N-acetylmuramoyl-L-alanine amidase [Monaibacterium marinum]